MFDTSLGYALKLDNADPLAELRNAFYLPKTTTNNNKIYLCGNSLGLQTKTTEKYIQKELVAWRDLAISGFFSQETNWSEYQHRLKPVLSSLLGCQEHEVTVMNSLTINLHLMLASFYKNNTKIIMLETAFPSDRFAVNSFLEARNVTVDQALIYIKPDSQGLYQWEEIAKTLKEHADASIILIEGVHYLTGQILPMQAISELAHQFGMYVGLDLAHAILNIPLNLNLWQIDFAVWCSYKYLNGGPGAVGGCYIHERYHKKNLPRLAGWWGSAPEERFSHFANKNLKPQQTVDGWQVSTTAVLNSVALLASIDLIKTVNLKQLYFKAYSLTKYFYELVIHNLPENVFQIITPFNKQKMGSQLSLAILKKDVYQKIVASCKDQNNPMVFDLRGDNILRAAPVPLYNNHADIWYFTQYLASFVAENKNNV